MYNRIFNGQKVRATLSRRGNINLIVTFDSWMRGRSGFGKVNFSKQFKALNYDQLCIQTSANDWFENDEFNELPEKIFDVFEAYSNVQMLGFSMGGYACVQLANKLPNNGYVVVSPNVCTSCNSKRSPNVLRRNSKNNERRNIIVFDPRSGSDRDHVKWCVERTPNVQIAPLIDGGHPATNTIKQAGRFGEFINLVVSGQADAKNFVSLHESITKKTGCGKEQRCRTKSDQTKNLSQISLLPTSSDALNL